MKSLFFIALSVGLLQGKEHPNVLWITLEDTSPHFIGCYGNTSTKTPNIDALAKRGIRFERAFANAPVCSAARSTIITGALNETLGTGNHRSGVPLPDSIKGFPTYLREAGYYTSNNSKTDYATSSAKRIIVESWNESSGKAGWWKREKEQPFFSVFNLNDSHQSRTMTFSYDWYRRKIFDQLKPSEQVQDDDFELPPFIPDTKEFRRHFARVYNCISIADRQVGEILEKLEADQLTDDTIIFCYADHGEAMPRGKANPIGLGYRVPFIVVFPEKWQHLNPWGSAGTATDELICFDDLGPSMLSLVGKKATPWMTGRPILGSFREEPRPYAFSSRNRIDESEGCSRSITDGRFLYTRHFLPGPEYKFVKYFDVADISRLLRKNLKLGTLSEVQQGMFKPQPFEVLYDLESDQWETTNLTQKPEHQERLNTFRQELFNHIIDIKDIMLRPEYELAEISKTSTCYEYAQQEDPARLEEVLMAARLASNPNTPAEKILELLDSPDPIVSYWASTAFRSEKLSPPDKKMSYPPANIEMAFARYASSTNEPSFSLLSRQIQSKNKYLRLQTLQRIQTLEAKAAPFQASLEKALKGGSYDTQGSAQVTLHLIDGRPLSIPDPN